VAERSPHSLHRWAGIAASATAGEHATSPSINIPKRFAHLSERVQAYLGKPPTSAGDALEFLEYFDAFRQGSQLSEGLLVLAAIDESFNSSDVALIEEGFRLAAGISGKQFVDEGLQGLDIKTAISRERMRQLTALFTT
jgi:hypothetical protein